MSQTNRLVLVEGNTKLKKLTYDQKYGLIFFNILLQATHWRMSYAVELLVLRRTSPVLIFF
jgi:hypothetical protein